MKKIVFLFFVTVALQSCTGSDKKNTPAGGAGKDQAPTLTSADSSNGYGDKTASDSLNH
jgi:hypothetical protein